jgi:uncharacterized RDD family membrane protein YckC
VYEALLLTALLLVAGFAVLPLISPRVAVATHAAAELYVLPPASGAFLFLYYFVVAGVYCISFWTRGRRTLAMKTWGLALVDHDGAQVSSRRAIRRYFAAWIGPMLGLGAYLLAGRWGLVAGLAGLAWALADPDHQFLHDRLAGTRLVRG